VWSDARSDKFDVVEVDDVQVLQRAMHAAMYGGRGVVKVSQARISRGWGRGTPPR
jgi:hypothetical protein